MHRSPEPQPPAAMEPGKAENILYADEVIPSLQVTVRPPNNRPQAAGKGQTEACVESGQQASVEHALASYLSGHLTNDPAARLKVGMLPSLKLRGECAGDTAGLVWTLAPAPRPPPSSPSHICAVRKQLCP